MVCGANLLALACSPCALVVHAGRMTNIITTFLYGSSLYAKADGLMTAATLSIQVRDITTLHAHSGVSSFTPDIYEAAG